MAIMVNEEYAAQQFELQGEFVESIRLTERFYHQTVCYFPRYLLASDRRNGGYREKVSKFHLAICNLP